MKDKKIKNIELPDSTILEVVGKSGFGDLVAKAIDFPEFKHKIYIIENKRIKPELEEGDKILGNVFNKKGTYFVKPIIRTFRSNVEQEKIYGVVAKENGRFILKLAEKRSNKEFPIDNVKDENVGDYVSCLLIGASKSQTAKFVKNFGKFDLHKATQTLILEKYEIPFEFSDKSTLEAKSLKEYSSSKRVNYTKVPFVTIDGEDSKDFDDAVCAKKTAKGFEIMVAIADVSFYVKPQMDLDRDAYKRGNSVYLPNMVVPMLPETLSNDLCSLRPKEDRPVMVCTINIDNEGSIINYKFERALINSFARLTYKEVQNAFEGNVSTNISPLFKTSIQPLYEAFYILEKARKKRGALELMTSEVNIKLDKQGQIMMVSTAEQLTSHKLIEEMMILANVCAAKQLQKSKLPVMYRIHEKPQSERLIDVKPILKEFGMNLPDQAAILPSHFNRVLEEASRKGFAQGISDIILRLQSQARYSPENIGHFGLSLTDYAHFTSPIRRYSDILVHRALIKACNLPEGGELEDNATFDTFKDIADHLCVTERRAVSAERDLVARYLASYLTPSIGSDFEVKISGMSTAGVFVSIESLGVEGFIPMRSLPNDDYDISSSNVEMHGRRRKTAFVLGHRIRARLLETSAVTGSVIFKYIDTKEGLEYQEKSSSRFRRFDKNDRKGGKDSKPRGNRDKSKNRKDSSKDKKDSGKFFAKKKDAKNSISKPEIKKDKKLDKKKTDKRKNKVKREKISND